MTTPTPAALADSMAWPLGRRRLAWRAKVRDTADAMQSVEPFGRRWNSLHRDLVHAERVLTDLEGKPVRSRYVLSTSEAVAVVAHAAALPVQQADVVVDRMHHQSGIEWLRASGYTSAKHPRNVRPVDTADVPVDTAEGAA